MPEYGRRMPRSDEISPVGRSAETARHLRHTVHRWRTEGGGSARESAAVALGVFIGCLPIYGFHLALCWLAGRLLALNRLKMYVAANISNPLFAPAILLAELQAGAWLRRGELHALTLRTVRSMDPWTFGADLAVGSVAFGAALGALAGLLTWAGRRRRAPGSPFDTLVQRASDRYVPASVIAWEFARAKMSADPLYRTAVMSGVLPPGGVLLDVGCGQGLMLALLAELRTQARRGEWAGPGGPPVFERLVGIDTRSRVAALARTVLAGDAEVLAADVRTHAPEPCDAVLLFDVLHLMPAAAQEAVLAALARALNPGGTILVREADAAAGWRFRAVQAGNRIKAFAFGHWRQTFHFRAREDWRRLFESAGFSVDTRQAGDGTPFANVLFVLRTPARASA